MKKAILSLSGGLDSTALLLHLIEKKYEIHTISYYYGQKNKSELDGLDTIFSTKDALMGLKGVLSGERVQFSGE